MRFWDPRVARAARDAALGLRDRVTRLRNPASNIDEHLDPEDAETVRTDEDFERLVHEGALVALSAVRLATKNGLILATLRDRAPWQDDAALALARRALLALIAELEGDTVRIERDSRTATAAARAARAASVSGPSSRRSRTERTRLRDEVQRLEARARSLRGVIERLRVTEADEELRREVVLRARDEALSELMQARLIPQAPMVALSAEAEREAIAGVKADLARLIEEHEGY